MHAMYHRLIAFIAIFVVGGSLFAGSTPAGSAFTYQGKLYDSSNPVNSTADVRCSLWDASTDGTEIGSMVTVSSVVVADGLFSLELDFGPGSFDGNARWIEIAVRVPHDPSDTQPYVTLSPRQPLRPAPYSVHALNSAPATLPDGGEWLLNSSLNVENNTFVIEHGNQNIGIGTDIPIHKLDVHGNIFANNAVIGINGVAKFIPDGSTISVPIENAMAFNTGGIERVRITSNGSLGVGRVPTANRFELNGNASKSTAGSWLANSDARIKTDVQTVKNALDILEDVRLVSFQYTPQYLANHPGIVPQVYYNVIAQEFAEVFPEYVSTSGEQVPPTGPRDRFSPVGNTPDENDILQVDIHPLIIYSAAAIQELNKKHEADVEQLRSKITTVESENAMLQNRLRELERAVQRLEANINRIARD